MTNTLPPATEFHKLLVPLQKARDAAYMVSALQDANSPLTEVRELAVIYIKEVVDLLGFEMVQRVPVQTNVVELRDGGRMGTPSRVKT